MTVTPTPDAAIRRAQAEADAARTDLVATLHELQRRLDPREMARNAVEVARDRGEDIAERGIELARAKPGVAAGAAVGVVALLARRPLLRGLRALFRRTPKSETSYNTLVAAPYASAANDPSRKDRP